MLVNIEFLDKEPIENMITCLNYKVDKVIFFGYKEDIEVKREQTEAFLKRRCHVEEVEFYELSRTNLDDALLNMSEVIDREQSKGNQVFFDVTGGEDLVLIAFGMLAAQKSLAMHKYDIETGWLYELNGTHISACSETAAASQETQQAAKPIALSQAATKQDILLDIDKYIEMFGGKVNYTLQKDTKSLDDLDFADDVAALWEICNRYKKSWNIFSEFLRDYCQPDIDLFVTLDIAEVRADIKKGKKFGRKDIKHIFDECVDIGVFKNFYDMTDNLGETCTFSYKNEEIQDVLWDAGAVLELHTYMQESVNSQDCKVGVHLDWDGVIEGRWGNDTVNEIDVLSLRGYIPTFISCKNGNVDQMALYELETVASRFGGKYSKKVLVAPQGMNKAHRIRAREMGIEVRQ